MESFVSMNSLPARESTTMDTNSPPFCYPTALDVAVVSFMTFGSVPFGGFSRFASLSNAALVNFSIRHPGRPCVSAVPPPLRLSLWGCHAPLAADTLEADPIP